MMQKAHVSRRMEEQALAMDPDQQALVRRVANDLHRLNQSIAEAVDSGISIELIRAARHHGGGGHWGDLIAPAILVNRPEHQ